MADNSYGCILLQIQCFWMLPAASKILIAKWTLRRPEFLDLFRIRESRNLNILYQSKDPLAAGSTAGEMLSRALQRLGAEQYGRRSQFLQELIQNENLQCS